MSSGIQGRSVCQHFQNPKAPPLLSRHWWHVTNILWVWDCGILVHVLRCTAHNLPQTLSAIPYKPKAHNLYEAQFAISAPRDTTNNPCDEDLQHHTAPASLGRCQRRLACIFYGSGDTTSMKQILHLHARDMRHCQQITEANFTHSIYSICREVANFTHSIYSICREVASKQPPYAKTNNFKARNSQPHI